MKEVDGGFRERVYVLVSQIPKGRVMTYGQIAATCGNPRAARIVGGIAHQAPCANQDSCKTTRQTDLRGVQGAGKQRSKAYMKYDEQVVEPATQQSPKSISRVSGSAREQANAFCPSCDIPWHRVVKKDGSLAEGFPGGVEGHKQALEVDGVKINNLKIDVSELLWRP